MNITDKIKNTGLRCTKVREEVLGLLIEVAHPISHADIFSRKKFTDFDRVTIYRTLDAFFKVGLIHQIKGSDGISRFGVNFNHSKNKCSGNHIHFLCSFCNQMTCLSEQPLPWIDVPKGSEIYSKQLVVYGKCSKCAPKI